MPDEVMEDESFIKSDLDKGYHVAVLPSAEAYTCDFPVSKRAHHKIGAMKCKGSMFWRYTADHDDKWPDEMAMIEH